MTFKFDRYRLTDDGTGAQRQTRSGPAADQARAEDTALRAADPAVAEAHRLGTPGLPVAHRRAEGGARARRQDQLHGARVTRVGAAADDPQGGAVAR